MTARALFRRLRSRRGLIVLAMTAAVLAVGGPNAWAWYHLRAGRAALERYQPEEARHHLENCLRVWPASATAHLLASRAARQEADFDAAARHLHECQSAGGSNEDTAFEWALLQAAGGNAREVEEYLDWRKDQDPRLATLVWEALAEGYVRVYRILDALAMLDHWLKVQPDNLRALELRGLAYQNGKSAQKGADDFRRVIELDRSRAGARRRLVFCLLEIGSYDEALPHLEWLDREKPGDPETRTRIARCLNMLGRGPEARHVLDEVIAAHPEQELALLTRAQFALTDRQPALAEGLLRRAVAAKPGDYQAHFFLTQALQQQGKVGEAKEESQLADVVKSRAERLGDLRSRRLSVRPLDPALHYEMGLLLIQDGYGEIGADWLQSALNLDPDYKPAHAALADYFARTGDLTRAAEHRARQ